MIHSDLLRQTCCKKKMIFMLFFFFFELRVAEKKMDTLCATARNGRKSIFSGDMYFFSLLYYISIHFVMHTHFIDNIKANKMSSIHSCLMHIIIRNTF